MNPSSQKNIKQLLVYQKALEIFKLSRHIASYISYDKNVLKMRVSSSPNDVFINEFLIKSLRLAPNIAAAESQNNPKIKLKYAKSLQRITEQLNSYCTALDRNSPQGRNFIKLLRDELDKFKKLQQGWVMSF